MLPTALVIGAQKAGTTSLWEYLNQHPDIYMAPQKEVHFFDRPLNWSHGVSWYEKQFAGWRGEQVVGEATPAYARFPLFLQIPERAFAIMPEARLIYVVRHPVERIRSHYVHDRGHGFEREPFATAVLNKSTYVDTSRYALQIDEWLRFYPRSALMVLTSDALRRKRVETMSRVYDFLGVDATWTPPEMEYHTTAETFARPKALLRLQRTTVGQLALERIPGSVKRRVAAPLNAVINRPVATDGAELSPALRLALEDLVRDDVRRLRAYLDDDFDGWGIA